MTNRQVESTTVNSPKASTARLLPWFAGVSLIAFAAGAHLGKANTLSASFGNQGFGTQGNLDSDLDGLTDVHEDVLGLSPDLADTDDDGWSDLEEVTRGSNPKSNTSVPKKSSVDVEVTGYMDDGTMHIIATIYLKGGAGSGQSFRLGLYHRGVAYMLPPKMYLPYSEVSVVPGRGVTDKIYVLDVKLPPRLIMAFGELSFFATTRGTYGGPPTETATLNLVASGGVPYQVSAPVGLPKNPTPGSKARGRGFYTPLTPLNNLPAGSTKGKVCVQTSRVVGAGGPGMQLEVTAASCQEGDGACASTCSGSVGQTFGTLDPLVLIGG